MPTWFVLALGSAIASGGGSILVKIAYRLFSQAQVYFLTSVAFLFWWTVWGWIAKIGFIAPTGWLWLLPGLPPLVFTLFVVALQKGEVSTVLTITSAVPLVTLLLAMVFLAERPTWEQVLAVVGVVVGLILLNWEGRKKGGLAGFWWSIAVTLGFGTTNITSKFVIDQIGVYSFAIVNGGWMLLIALAWLIFSSKERRIKWSKLLSLEGGKGVFGAFCYTLGGVLLFAAFAKGPVSLVSPVASLSTPLAVILASLFLKEKISLMKATAIVLILGSAVFLGRV